MLQGHIAFTKSPKQSSENCFHCFLEIQDRSYSQVLLVEIEYGVKVLTVWGNILVIIALLKGLFRVSVE